MRKVLTNEDELILEEIYKKCNWYQRIIVKKNKNLILDIYNQGRIKAINTMLL